MELTGALRLTLNSIDFLPMGIGTGFAQVQPTSIGYFAPLGGFTAQELDLIGLPVGVQLGGNGGLGLLGFETFQGSPLPGLSFILDMIVSCGQASLNPVDECDAGLNSQFQFDEDALGTSLILNFSGRVVDTDKSRRTEHVHSEIRRELYRADTATDPRSARPNRRNFYALLGPKGIRLGVQAVPEPATLLTFGAGTVLLAAHRRRGAREAQSSH